MNDSHSHVLDRVASFLHRFIAYPSDDACIAHVLWIAHAHLMDAWDSTPRLAFLSPEPGSGKSRCLEVTELLVPRPVEAVNVTAPYLFRKVGDGDGRPTILYDEIDTVFGPKARDHEEIRGLLNAGHRRNAVAGRCVLRGKIVATEEIPAYCAVALAGLGSLPDTILSRSVVVRMRRRAPSERVEPFRKRMQEPEGRKLYDDLAAWALEIEPSVTGAWPEMPPGINDRDADCWEALLAVADAAGGDWPAKARNAALAFVAASKQNAESLGVKLLTDLRALFEGHEQLATQAILTSLWKMDESPWGSIKGEPLDARQMARLLAEYGIRPMTLRVGTSTPKGYRRADLHDAWARYLGLTPTVSATSETSATG